MALILALALLFIAGMAHPLHAQQTYPNVRISSPSEEPDEVTIAINPIDPRNLIVGANISYFARSTDGGWTWEEGHLASAFGVWGDPCIIFDPEGSSYFAHLSNPPGGYWLDRLVVQKSTNGGATWNGGVPVATIPPHQHDKEWLIADFTPSPHRNNLYMSWTEFDTYASPSSADSSRVLFSRSTDLGASWSEPITISDRGGDCIDSDSTVQGAIPAVGPNGEIYTSWSGPLGLMFDKSADGGRTFGVDSYIGPQPGGWDFSIPGLQRCNGFPITLCDLSHTARRGHIYIIFSDQRNGADNTDIFFIRSTNGGDSWTEPRKVNSDTTRRHQFLPWAALDTATGDLWAVFYDRRATAGNATDVYVAKSTDGGESWSDFKVSESSFVPTATAFLGDYIGIAAYRGVVRPVWTRMDNRVTSVWTAIIGDSSRSGVNDREMETSDRAGLVALQGGSFGAMTRITFATSRRGMVELQIHDALGRPVRRLIEGELEAGLHPAWWDGSADDGSPAPSGIYFVVLKAEGGSDAWKTMVVR